MLDVHDKRTIDHDLQRESLTTMTYRAHHFRGVTIYPCAWTLGEHRGRWYVQSYHSTGMPYADEVCSHFHTLSDAREFIASELAEMERYAS